MILANAVIFGGAAAAGSRANRYQMTPIEMVIVGTFFVICLAWALYAAWRDDIR